MPSSALLRCIQARTSRRPAEAARQQDGRLLLPRPSAKDQLLTLLLRVCVAQRKDVIWGMHKFASRCCRPSATKLQKRWGQGALGRARYSQDETSCFGGRRLVSLNSYKFRRGTDAATHHPSSTHLYTSSACEHKIADYEVCLLAAGHHPRGRCLSNHACCQEPEPATRKSASSAAYHPPG